MATKVSKIQYTKPPSPGSVAKKGKWTTSNDVKKAEFNATRDGLLSKSDWTQMPDSPLSDAVKQQWTTWRQKLRDIPKNMNTPTKQLAALKVLINSKPQG